MAELLFEIMCEEIPARMQVKAGGDLGRMVSDALKKAGLSVEGLETYTGPRRLALVASVPARSPDVSEERKGPRTSAPEQALAGFMRGAGITDISQAEIRSDKKGEYYVAMLEKKGRAASDIIAEILPEIMSKFPWPKSMKSGTTSFRWVRPLQSLLCLLDGAVVPFEVNGFKAGNVTSGHRRMGAGPFTARNFKDYKQVLETKGHVLIDACARKDIILKDAQAACKKAGLELVEDEGLLSEVAGLAEWPMVILGDMDESFLKLPAEVIRLSMRTHQKYFAVRDPKTGDLAPKFIVVANQVAPDGGVEIAKGNSRVLSARLDDARFFQAEDVRDGKKLIDNCDRLGGIIFHQKLGSLGEKVGRMNLIAQLLVPATGADSKKVDAAVKLSKCDLLTQTVMEFTSLQGQVGRMMYEREGGDLDVALAIEEHYKPQGPNDKVPTNPVSVTVALADKLDTLNNFWAIGEKPTGSKDPYALRRAALGVIRIILENGLRIKLRRVLFLHLNFSSLMRKIGTAAHDISEMSKLSPEIRGEKLTEEDLMLALQQKMPKLDVEKGLDDPVLLEEFMEFANENFESINDLLGFMGERIKVYLRDQGKRHDIINAAFELNKPILVVGDETGAVGEENASEMGLDPVAIVDRVEALQSFLSTDAGTNLLAGYKRAANILKAEAKKGDLPTSAPHKGSVPEEAALFVAIGKASPLVEAALAAEDYAGAMTALAGLRGPIDGFFEGVIVNSDVAAERENRLGLLIQIRTLAGTIADFDKIEG